FRILNKKKLLADYDVLVDLNFIEPEKLTGRFNFFNFLGVLFVILSLRSTVNMNKFVVVCSATIGPYGCLLNKLVKKYLDRVDLVTYRESYSQRYVDFLGINNP